MGWGQNPGEVKAAEEAQRKAIEAAESRPMSPFERKLIDVLEDIRDSVADFGPVALEPLVGRFAVEPPGAYGELNGELATDIRDRLGGDVLPPPGPDSPLPEAHVQVVHPDGTVQDFGSGVYLSTVDPEPLAPLLDSPPDVLTRAIQAGGLALSNSFPTFRGDLTATGFEKLAEVAIEAALHEAARDTSAVQQSSGDEVGEGALGPSPAARNEAGDGEPRFNYPASPGFIPDGRGGEPPAAP